MIDWSGLIMIEGEMTGDGRLFEEGSVRWVDPPFSLKLSHELDAPVIGNVTSITREGNKIFARGGIDETTEDGQEALRRLDDSEHPAFASGVSIEIDEMEAEVRVAPETMQDMDQPPETAEDGKLVVWKMGADQELLVVTDARIRALALSTVAAFVDAKIKLTGVKAAVTAAMAKIYQIVDDLRMPADEDDSMGGMMVGRMDMDWDEMAARDRVFDEITNDDGSFDAIAAAEAFAWVDPDGDPADAESYQLGFTDVGDDGLVIVPEGVQSLPLRSEELLVDRSDLERAAVQDRICGLYATVRSVHSDFPSCPYEPEEAIISGGGVTYPAALFEDPRLEGPTGIRVTEVDGVRHVTGHLALWETCHTAFDGHCVMPPASKTDYNRFHLHSVNTDRGPLAVGKITVDTTHARRQATAHETIRHYEDTGIQAATIRVGEDSWGIWAAGVIPAHVPEEQAQVLMDGAPLSGDWRWDASTKNLELRGVLAVNIPGFPVPRYAMAASGLPASVQVGYDPRLERAIETFRVAEAEAEMAGV